MRYGDAQVGAPGILFKDTKANIEARTDLVEGMDAYATDTHQFGSYGGGAWTWGQIGHVIQDEGMPLTQRPNLNFTGTGVTATDDAGNNRTNVTIPGAGKYRQFVYEVSGGDFHFVIDGGGQPVMALQSLE